MADFKGTQVGISGFSMQGSLLRFTVQFISEDGQTIHGVMEHSVNATDVAGLPQAVTSILEVLSAHAKLIHFGINPSNQGQSFKVENTPVRGITESLQDEPGEPG